jgi:hypothetical protein
MFKVSKKAFLIVLIGFSSLLFFACDAIHSLDFSQQREKNITQIELINYDDLEAKDDQRENRSFSTDKVTILETLDSAEIESFLEEFSSIGIPNGPKESNDLHSHYGIGIIIIFDDDSFEVVTLPDWDNGKHLFCALYDSDKKRIDSKTEYDSEMITDFKELLKKYFTTPDEANES